MVQAMDGLGLACGFGYCSLDNGASVTTAHKVHAVFTVALVLLLGGIGTFWVKDMIAKARAEATLEAEKNYRAAVEQERKEKLAEIAKDVKDAKTPEQAIHILPKYVPVPFNVPTYVTPIDGKLPDAPQGQKYALVGANDKVLTESNIVPLAQFGGKCAEDAVNLTACTANLESANRDKKTLQESLKGGTKWQRVLKAAKCLGFSGAGAGLGTLVSKNKPAGAVAGAVVGTIGCQLF